MNKPSILSRGSKQIEFMLRKSTKGIAQNYTFFLCFQLIHHCTPLDNIAFAGSVLESVKSDFI